MKLPGLLLDQGDCTANGSAAAGEHFQHAGQASVQVDRPGQCLADINQRPELSGLAGLGACRS
jgi:hypothetical protein